MNRLLSRVGVRAASVGLLVLGIVGGVYLGQNRTTQQQTAETQLVVQATSNEMQLLKKRQGEHAAARAWQRQAEGEAAAKAADQAKTVAEKARKLEKKAIEKKKADEAEEKAKKAAASSSSSSGGGDGGAYAGPIPESCSEYSGHRETGCAIMLDRGFGIDQFPCLDKLWKKESGWSPSAHNNSSGAHGIPQALPGNKMASVGSDWRTNAATQIKWGLNYIEGRYGTPCKAWAKSQSSGWY